MKKKIAKEKIINVVQDDKNPIKIDILAKSIKNISDAISKLSAGELNRRAIILLISNSAKENQSTVENVLRAVENLPKDFLKVNLR